MCRIQPDRPRSALAFWLICLAAMLAALPSSAIAASAVTRTSESSYEELVFRASPGELNDLTITREPSGQYRLRDLGAPIAAGGGCVTVDAQEVVCPAQWVRVAVGDGADRVAVTAASGATLGRVLILGGQGSDSIQLAAGPDTSGRRRDAQTDFVRDGRFRGSYSVDAGAGDDLVTGSGEDDVLVGEEGADVLAGGDGDDLLAGGLGRDALRGDDGGDLLLGGELRAFERGRTERGEFDDLEGGAGPDLLAGGPRPDRLGGGDGNDLLFYSAPRGTLSVTFDGRGNDGPRGEGDNVRAADFEGALLTASGRLAVSGALGFGGGSYTLVGGRETRGALVLLSSRGTGGDSLVGRFSRSSFSVSLDGSVARIEARGGSRRICRRRATQSGYSSPQAYASYRALRRILATIRRPSRRRGRHAAAAARPIGSIEVLGRASVGRPVGEATWLTTDTCAGTLTRVRDGEVIIDRRSTNGVRRRTIRRLRSVTRGRFRARGQRHSSAFVRG